MRTIVAVGLLLVACGAAGVGVTAGDWSGTERKAPAVKRQEGSRTLTPNETQNMASARPGPYSSRARRGGEPLVRKNVRVAQRRGSRGGSGKGKRPGRGSKNVPRAKPSTGSRWTTSGAQKDYVGKLGGNSIHFPGVKGKKISYTKRDPAETSRIRREFDSSVRSRFLKSIANDPDKAAQLRRAGIMDEQIRGMKAGKVPHGYNVHHKMPIDGGGGNDFSNLILIKREPYHYSINHAQNDLTSGMNPGETRNIYFPVPDGFLYPLASP